MTLLQVASLAKVEGPRLNGRFLRQPGSDCGESPIRQAREAIGLGLAAERYQAELLSRQVDRLSEAQ